MIGVGSYLLIGFGFHRLSRTKAAPAAAIAALTSNNALLGSAVHRPNHHLAALSGIYCSTSQCSSAPATPPLPPLVNERLRQKGFQNQQGGFQQPPCWF
jgi:hypothetical protein